MENKNMILGLGRSYGSKVRLEELALFFLIIIPCDVCATFFSIIISFIIVVLVI